MASQIPTIDIQNTSNIDSSLLLGLPATGLRTALVRAKETNLPEDKRRFNDPYAAKLVEPVMENLIERSAMMTQDKDRLGLNHFQIFLFLE